MMKLDNFVEMMTGHFDIIKVAKVMLQTGKYHMKKLQK